MLDRGLDLPAMAKEIGYMPANENIVQIKGKGNKKPVDKYLPMVQDFVKSGNWGDVGDLHNTGLLKVGGDEPLHGYQEWMRLRSLGNEPKVPVGYYTPEELVKYGEESGLKEKHPSVYDAWRKNLGLEPDVPLEPPVEATPNIPPPETPQFKRGGLVRRYADGGEVSSDEDLSKPFFGNPNIQRQGAHSASQRGRAFTVNPTRPQDICRGHHSVVGACQHGQHDCWWRSSPG